MKICGICKIEKDLSEFYTDSSKSGYRYMCKPCDKIRIANIQLNTKQEYIEYWESSRNHSGCLYCGYRHYFGALDFHHRDPSQKDFTLICSRKKRPWEEVKAEIDKCDLVCAIHHREIHGRSSLS